MADDQQDTDSPATHGMLTEAVWRPDGHPASPKLTPDSTDSGQPPAKPEPSAPKPSATDGASAADIKPESPDAVDTAKPTTDGGGSTGGSADFRSTPLGKRMQRDQMARANAEREVAQLRKQLAARPKQSANEGGDDDDIDDDAYVRGSDAKRLAREAGQEAAREALEQVERRQQMRDDAGATNEEFVRSFDAADTPEALKGRGQQVLAAFMAELSVFEGIDIPDDRFDAIQQRAYVNAMSKVSAPSTAPKPNGHSARAAGGSRQPRSPEGTDTVKHGAVAAGSSPRASFDPSRDSVWVRD